MPGSTAPGWPVVLGPRQSSAGEVLLRPLARRDGRPWREIRLADRQHLERWDVTSSETWQERHSAAGWRLHYSLMRRAARIGECLPFAITLDGRFVGQVTLGGIVRGALSCGWVGYWVASSITRHGVGTMAVAMAMAHGFGPVGLHRIEATIDPANVASRAVVGNVGMREEGLLRRYLNIAGAWRDHLLFALTEEEMPGGVDPVGALLARSHRGDPNDDRPGDSHDDPV